MSTVRYLSFDPGNTTGFCFFDTGGNVLKQGQLTLDQLSFTLSMLTKTNVGFDAEPVVIVESFELLEKVAVPTARNKSTRDLQVSQAIGMVKLFAQIKNATLVIQTKDRLGPGQGWTGVNIDSAGHDKSHWKSAFVHGMYYLVMNDIHTVDSARKVYATITT